ncbi:MAG: hypothetical protein ABGW78_03260, partial [Pirellulales bacterium]
MSHVRVNGASCARTPTLATAAMASAPKNRVRIFLYLPNSSYVCVLNTSADELPWAVYRPG